MVHSEAISAQNSFNSVEFQAAVTPFACCQNSNLLSPVKINKEMQIPIWKTSTRLTIIG